MTNYKKLSKKTELNNNRGTVKKEFTLTAILTNNGYKNLLVNDRSIFIKDDTTIEIYNSSNVTKKSVISQIDVINDLIHRDHLSAAKIATLFNCTEKYITKITSLNSMSKEEMSRHIEGIKLKKGYCTVYDLSEVTGYKFSTLRCFASMYRIKLDTKTSVNKKLLKSDNITLNDRIDIYRTMFGSIYKDLSRYNELHLICSDKVIARHLNVNKRYIEIMLMDDFSISEVIELIYIKPSIHIESLSVFTGISRDICIDIRQKLKSEGLKYCNEYYNIYKNINDIKQLERINVSKKPIIEFINDRLEHDGHVRITTEKDGCHYFVAGSDVEILDLSNAIEMHLIDDPYIENIMYLNSLI